MANCSDTCHCRNLICAITFLVIGVVFIVAGGVIAAVGFGTRPIDMFDNRNLAMRLVGLILAGAGILPVIMGTMFAMFFCASKRGVLPGQKKELKHNVEMSVITKPYYAGQVEYPYPSEGGPLIYKPGQTVNGSLTEENHYDDQYTLPINQSGRSFSGGGMEPGHIYSEVKDSEQNTKTTTTTTTTRVYKTEILEGNMGSGSSDGNGPQEKKTKHKKKHQAGPNGSITGSVSSEVPSFNDGDIPLQHKTKHPKKQKKHEYVERHEDEELDDTDEPLPGGRYRSNGSSSSDAQKPILKSKQLTAASPSYQDENDTPTAAVYGKVKRK